MAAYFLPNQNLMALDKKAGRYIAGNKSFPSTEAAIMIHNDEQQVKHLSKICNGQCKLVCCIAYARGHGIRQSVARNFCQSALGRYFGSITIGSRVHPYYLPDDTPLDIVTLGATVVFPRQPAVKHVILALLERSPTQTIARNAVIEQGYGRSAVNTAIHRLEKEGLIVKLGRRAITLVDKHFVT
jgi:hypothetical protein